VNAEKIIENHLKNTWGSGYNYDSNSYEQKNPFPAIWAA
jgi:hypothetical protein